MAYERCCKVEELVAEREDIGIELDRGAALAAALAAEAVALDRTIIVAEGLYDREGRANTLEVCGCACGREGRGRDEDAVLVRGRRIEENL